MRNIADIFWNVNKAIIQLKSEFKNAISTRMQPDIEQRKSIDTPNSSHTDCVHDDLSYWNVHLMSIPPWISQFRIRKSFLQSLAQHFKNVEREVFLSTKGEVTNESLIIVDRPTKGGNTNEIYGMLLQQYFSKNIILDNAMVSLIVSRLFFSLAVSRCIFLHQISPKVKKNYHSNRLFTSLSAKGIVEVSQEMCF